MTTTLHFSGLNTDPLFLIHLASDSRCRVYPQVSLLPCRPDFSQVGLVLFNTHPLGNTNQFHLFSENPEVPNLSRHKQRLVSGYFTGSTPRSLHIFRAKMSLISECRGIADRLFCTGLCHHECLPPSRKRSHPWLRRYLRSSFLFIWRFFLPCSRCLQMSMRPGG